MADTAAAITGADGRNHRWCSATPWACALSIFRAADPTSLLNSAPFHPTPDGQRRFAALVTPVVRRALGG